MSGSATSNETESGSGASGSQPKGLTTLALLQANYDAGRDYLSMFLPFVLDTIRARDSEDFSTPEIQDDISGRHCIRIPTDALEVLLTRAKRGNVIEREGGRYFRQPNIYRGPEVVDLDARRAEVSEEQERLAEAFVDYAAGSSLVDADSTEEAVGLLLGFLNQYQVDILIGDYQPIDIPAAASLDKPTEIGTAKFIRDECLPDDFLRSSLERLLEGFVLQNALFLRDIASPRRDFLDLTVYLDTPFLFDALGLAGRSHQRPTREALDLLQDVKADLRVFRRTIAEMKRVLSYYEDHLATPQGKSELPPTPMARHFLQNHYTPSKVRQISSLLEQQVERLGVTITETPDREPELTFDEGKLTEYLARDGDDLREDPRVRHDVNCTAAVLTRRRGRQSEDVENARAVMATTSPGVVATIQRWYEGEGLYGVSPYLNYRKLSSLAWLRNPSPGTDLEMAELTSLCSAAIRPSPRIWNSFTQRLEELVEAEEITSDEAVAAVTSDLTDEVLSDYEPKEELDAADTREAVERLKEEMREEAAEDREKLRNLELNIRYVAGQVAKWSSWAVTGLILLVLLAGLYALVAYNVTRPLWAWVGVGVVSVATVITWWRGHLTDFRNKVRKCFQRSLRSRLSQVAEYLLSSGADDVDA